MRLLYTLSIILVYSTAFAQQAGIIPMPLQFAKGSGYFTLNNHSSIGYHNEQLKTIAYYFQNELLSQKGITLQQKAKSANIVLVLKAGRRQADSCAYQISIKPEQVTISATHPNGIFYGIISLLQLALDRKSVV